MNTFHQLPILQPSFELSVVDVKNQDTEGVEEYSIIAKQCIKRILVASIDRGETVHDKLTILRKRMQSMAGVEFK